VNNKKNEEERKAREYAFKLLGRRDYASSRLKTKLEKRGYSQGIISRVIKYLVKASLLNDRKFALNYAYSRLKKKPRSSRVLEYELFKKGIPHQLVNEVISSVYNEVSAEVGSPWREEDLIRKVVKKEIGQGRITDEIRRRLCGKLLRLGFSYESIEKVTKSLRTE